MTEQELRTFREQVLAKIAAAPAPTAEMILRNRELIARAMPNDIDLRGNNRDRARRTAKLLLEFGDGATCPCAYCYVPLTAATLTQDKIYTEVNGGRYRMENLLPACLSCNSRRRDTLIYEFIEEAQAAIAQAESQLSTREEL